MSVTLKGAKKPKREPNTFNVEIIEETLTMGKLSGEAGAGMILAALIRQEWRKCQNFKPPLPWFTLGNGTLARYGVSKHVRLKLLKAWEAGGWLKINWGKAGNACHISVLKEF
jgi:hypothetical protein